jgi:hypothetical protein
VLPVRVIVTAGSDVGVELLTMIEKLLARA